jgi:hypothetical protein
MHKAAPANSSAAGIAGRHLLCGARERIVFSIASLFTMKRPKAALRLDNCLYYERETGESRVNRQSVWQRRCGRLRLRPLEPDDKKLTRVQSSPPVTVLSGGVSRGLMFPAAGRVQALAAVAAAGINAGSAAATE